MSRRQQPDVALADRDCSYFTSFSTRRCSSGAIARASHNDDGHQMGDVL